MDGLERTAEGKQSQQVFRPRRVLAATMAAAGLLWLGVLVYLFRFDGVPLKTFLSAAFFVLFFAVSVIYYGRTRIEVDSRGITCRGMVRTRRFSFADIRKLDVLPGPVTVYAIRGRRGFVHFTSFFRHHRYLATLLVERAGLSPLPG
ncbi:MAG: PH domain-containing protein [Myxococcaceae bacterium]|nr:MAG: PH domain-containing protein [Myxococcaceae bacterium]